MSNLSASLSNRSGFGFDPMDVVETFAEARNWTFERFGSDEIVISCPGQWGAYDLYFGWLRERNILQFAGAMNLSFPQKKRGEIERLIGLINNRLEMGHFGLEAQEKVLSFRHTIFPAHNVGVEHIDDLVDLAVREMENLYPAFQQMIWGGQAPERALEAVLFETRGQA